MYITPEVQHREIGPSGEQFLCLSSARELYNKVPLLNGSISAVLYLLQKILWGCLCVFEPCCTYEHAGCCALVLLKEPRSRLSASKCLESAVLGVSLSSIFMWCFHPHWTLRRTNIIARSAVFVHSSSRRALQLRQ